MTKEKFEWILGIGHICLCVTIIALVWAIMFPYYEDKGALADLIFSIIFGIGGIMLYIPLGHKLNEIIKYDTKQ